MNKQVNSRENGDINGEKTFIEALKLVISAFPKRAQEVLTLRYGLDGSGEKTLEEIGKTYKITRERVRQIIQELMKKLKNKRSHPAIDAAVARIIFTIKDKNGIIEEIELISILSKGSKHEGAAIRLITDSFDDFVKHETKQEMKKSISIADFNVADWKKLKNYAGEILKKESKPLHGSHFAEKIKLSFSDHNEKKIYDWLNVSEEIKKNNFGKWGLVMWREITPKNTREKAHIVLKETGKPLHFTEIAALIDKHGLSKKKTHCQTVHNELIKDSRFVLVGRGVYALAEWGYKQGTVKEILEDILKKKAKPMPKDDIIKEVLKMRQVKKSTVLINLNTFFEKIGKNEYSLKTK